MSGSVNTPTISVRNSLRKVNVLSLVGSRTSEHELVASCGMPAENAPWPGISISTTTRTPRERAKATMPESSSSEYTAADAYAPFCESRGNRFDSTGKEVESRICLNVLVSKRESEEASKESTYQCSTFSFNIAMPSIARLMVATDRKCRPVSIISPLYGHAGASFTISGVAALTPPITPRLVTWLVESERASA